jgi:hypothetical protein
LGLHGTWEPAEDPFFLPAAAGKALMQRLLGVKEEYRSEDVALASINRHGTFFGERFSIRTDHGPVHTACLAVGLDRWSAHIGEQREGLTCGSHLGDSLNQSPATGF